MDRQVRFVALGLVALFGLLFLQLNNLQLLQAHKLSSSPENPRNAVLTNDYPRGEIQTSNGVVVALSVPSTGPHKYMRRYPDGPIYADITGYYSYIYGSTGVESTYNSYLASHNAPVKHLSDLLNLTPRTVSDTLTLTIKSNLQQAAANALGSLTGAVVVLDPRTGAVLAMYSSPSYNPNSISSTNTKAVEQAWHNLVIDPSRPLVPRAFARAYPPGSTFKLVTSSAVYDHDPKLATVSFPVLTSLPLPNTNLQLANYAHEACGGKLPVLLQVSCDSGFGQIGLDLGANNLSAESDAFGFNKVPPLDLPGAAASTFPPPSQFAADLPALAYSAIGQQNVSATALQMALVTSAIANHGAIMVPHVMKEITNSQDQVVKSWQPTVWLHATTKSTAASVSSLMVGVVNGGTASNIALPTVQVAAKTGTSQTAPGKGPDNWMEAFAPASNPQVVVVAVVPAQPGVPTFSTGSSQAGPIVKTMLKAALGLG